MPDQNAPEVEIQAKQLGWVPKDQFKGPEHLWIDADTFVKRGEEILPIVNANNKKLSAKVEQLTAQLNETQRLVAAGNEALEGFREFHEHSLKEALKQQKEALMGKIQEARDNGDLIQEEDLRDQLAEVRTKEKDLNKPKNEAKPQPKPNSQEVHPDLAAWVKENPWYGPDKKLTRYADSVALEMRQDPANNALQGKAFFDAVAKVVAADFPEAFETAPAVDKVEGGGHRQSSGKGSKSYRDMPADAKAACDEFARKLVGPGRAYKDIDSWRTKYAQDFFAGE